MIAANWKMNLNVHEASLLAHQLGKKIKIHRDIEVVLAPTMLTLQPLSREIDRRQFKLAAQNAYFMDEGAFTGEVSFAQLRNVASYCIIGHSERRIYFNEDNKLIRDKVKAAVRNGITPILCVGENKRERDENETKLVLHEQVTAALAELTSGEIASVVIAYEPVWAIGTSTPEKPDSIAKAVNWIRMNVEELYGKATAESVRVLYGAGSEPELAAGILAVEGVDGLLVGHASLSADKFAGIVNAAYRLQTRIRD